MYQNDEHLQFITGMKLQDNKLIISSTRLQNYLIGILDGTDIKYRVIVNDNVKDLLYGSPCSSRLDRDYANYNFASQWNGMYGFDVYHNNNY